MMLVQLADVHDHGHAHAHAHGHHEQDQGHEEGHDEDHEEDPSHLHGHREQGHDDGHEHGEGQVAVCALTRKMLLSLVALAGEEEQPVLFSCGEEPGFHVVH